MTIYVVMANNFPDRAFVQLEAAMAYCRAKEHSTGSPQRIGYHIRDLELELP